MNAKSRLHVTPLDQTILSIVLPTPLRDQASDISFHTIATFPEANYGFFTIPTVEALRVKKKFHGSILRGRKMKVEHARPRRSAQNVTSLEDIGSVPVKNTRLRQSASSPQDIISGIEMPPTRKVKRGWTSDKEAPQQKLAQSKKSRQSFSDHEIRDDGDSKCLFVTKATPPESQKKGKRKREEKVVVPEFKNTVTLATSETNSPEFSTASQYDDTKGWVNEAGDVVEAVQTRKSVSNVASKVANVASPKVSGPRSGDPPDLSAVENDETSHTNLKASAKASSHGSSQKSKTRKSARGRKSLGVSATANDEIQAVEVERLSISRSSGSPVPQGESQPTSAPSSQVHPLEAFFKRPQAAASHSHTPKKPHLEVSTSFSFFGPDQEMPSNEESHTLLPQTPFTQQDFRHRRQRSAAPTPDTALPGKTFGDALARFGSEGGEDAESSDEESVTAGAGPADVALPEQEDKNERKEESEGAKWFFEHRGETNRSWKRRKREATKEKKLRERRAKR